LGIGVAGDPLVRRAGLPVYGSGHRRQAGVAPESIDLVRRVATSPIREPVDPELRPGALAGQPIDNLLHDIAWGKLLQP